MNNRRRGVGTRSGEFRIENDSGAVFEEAIRAGVLSEDPGKDNFAGHYMYMHHDGAGAGAAWFKHRETRAYVTMQPDASTAKPPRDPRRSRKTWFGLWVTAALVGVFLAGALLELDFGGPDIGTVRLNDLTAEFLAASVRGADSPEASAQAARIWGAELEKALEAVAVRHGVALLPTEAVAAGAMDYTAEVRAAMRWTAPAGTAPAGAAPGSTEYGDSASGAVDSVEYPETGPESNP